MNKVDKDCERSKWELAVFLYPSRRSKRRQDSQFGNQSNCFDLNLFRKRKSYRRSIPCEVATGNESPHAVNLKFGIFYMQRLFYCIFILSTLINLLHAQDFQGKPNIVYLLLDDAGYGDLSCYGQKQFQTPNIDRVASEGMRFTQHYSGSTVCAPTRCSLMTGLHTGHTFVRGNREVKPEGQAPMPADIVTIPRLLSDAGYITGAFGKWGLGAPSSESDPAKHFDTFYGYNCQREAHSYYPTHL